MDVTVGASPRVGSPGDSRGAPLPPHLPPPAARERRPRAFADIGEPWPASRRAIARTSPIVLQRPAPAVVALSLLRDSAPQVGLVVLMLLGAAALVLARFP